MANISSSKTTLRVKLSRNFQKSPQSCSKSHAANVKKYMKPKEKEREFTLLVKRLKGAITSVCMMYADERTPVDDLVQESLINIWQGFDSFQGRSDIKTWVLRVCINTCITMDRKRKSRPQTNSIDEACRNLFSENTDESIHESRLKELYRRIQCLGVFDRAIILLWIEGMSYDEIGNIVGISAKNVSVKLVRIRETLKKMSSHTTE